MGNIYTHDCFFIERHYFMHIWKTSLSVRNSDDGQELPHATEPHSVYTDEQIAKLFAKVSAMERDLSQEEVFCALEEIIFRVYTQLKKTDQLQKDILWNRSVRELLSSGETFYMHPCIDYTLLTIEHLKRYGFENIFLMIDELETPEWYIKLHFAINISYQGHLYSIDYMSRNTVLLWKWSFRSSYKNKEEQIKKSHRIEASYITLDDKFIDIVKKADIHFHYFNVDYLEFSKQKIERDHTPENFQKWFIDLVEDPLKPKVIRV